MLLFKFILNLTFLAEAVRNIKIVAGEINLKISVLFGTVLRTNNYLITSDNASILIEASCSLDELKSELNGKKLDAILLTHAH